MWISFSSSQPVPATSRQADSCFLSVTPLLFRTNPTLLYAPLPPHPFSLVYHIIPAYTFIESAAGVGPDRCVLSHIFIFYHLGRLTHLCTTVLTANISSFTVRSGSRLVGADSSTSNTLSRLCLNWRTAESSWSYGWLSHPRSLLSITQLPSGPHHLVTHNPPCRITAIPSAPRFWFLSSLINIDSCYSSSRRHTTSYRFFSSTRPVRIDYSIA